jgi:AbrB family looped-hinge helix DNA binding protein
MQEVKVDSKHRVVLPHDARNLSGIKAGSRLKVRVRGNSVVLTREVEPGEFIKNMEGILKKGTKIPAWDPLKLKEIWSAH